MMKPSYFLKVTYPIAIVMAWIYSPAVAMRALRSMVLVVCDIGFPGSWAMNSVLGLCI
jgi:hypothetical protein